MAASAASCSAPTNGPTARSVARHALLHELFQRATCHAALLPGSLDTIVGSNTWARQNRKDVFGPTVAAVKKAFTDVGHAVPDEFRQRTVGARDVKD